MKMNVPGWERGLRAAVSVAMILGGAALLWTGSLWWGLVVAGSGAGLLATALAGWCPVCATVGRTLPEVDNKVTVARL